MKVRKSTPGAPVPKFVIQIATDASEQGPQMLARDPIAALRSLALAGLILVAAVARAGADPVTLRLGYGAAAEEPLWLLLAKPDLAKNYGKAYAIEGTRFSGSDKRAQAFEAGAIDLASSSANGVIFGAAEGVMAK